MDGTTNTPRCSKCKVYEHLVQELRANLQSTDKYIKILSEAEDQEDQMHLFADSEDEDLPQNLEDLQAQLDRLHAEISELKQRQKRIRAMVEARIDGGVDGGLKRSRLDL